MYCPRAWPEVQLGGKPVPGHWSVICNKPHVYFDNHRQAGWPTKYKVRDFGNPENDGHGLTMLSHYTAWNKQGRTKDSVETWGVSPGRRGNFRVSQRHFSTCNAYFNATTCITCRDAARCPA